ncbi:MAG: hypothetical protein V4494_03495 [Chlamydiota bacterium]
MLTTAISTQRRQGRKNHPEYPNIRLFFSSFAPLRLVFFPLR